MALQPLRIPAGWTVSWNSWIDEDPSEDNFICFDGTTLFSADCNVVEPMLSLDIEYYPKNLEEGMFCAIFVSYKMRKGKVVEEERLGSYKTKSRLDMVEKIEKFMLEGKI
ncbi:hypothetical protein [Celerinatantimonas sp. MCCC 1A17872]|uniref:hypothetical protein n=1 Tax=Celerinatantimonas sp. MCCC 1A17872 TaxID=3177514 RepID=UPI0038C8E9EC